MVAGEGQDYLVWFGLQAVIANVFGVQAASAQQRRHAV
jgi:hypothetical protein